MGKVLKEQCLRCSGEMVSSGWRELELGKAGWFLGPKSDTKTGQLQVELYACKDCGKIEFYCETAQNKGD